MKANSSNSATGAGRASDSFPSTPATSEVSLDAYRLRGFDMDVRLDADGNVRFEQRVALH